MRQVFFLWVLFISSYAYSQDYKHNILGFDRAFGMYSSSMMIMDWTSNGKDGLRGMSIHYTRRIRPQIGVRFQMDFFKTTTNLDARSNHYNLGFRWSTNPTKRLQAYALPCIGFGRYTMLETDPNYGNTISTRGGFLDVGAAVGLDYHLMDWFVINSSFNFRLRSDIFTFFWGSAGLAFKF